MNLRELFVENINRTGESKSAVIGWGRGMGHRGHMFLASSVITHANETGADPYFVVSRTIGKDDPITPEEKLYLYKKVFPKMDHIFHAASDELPDLNRVLKHLASLGYSDVTVIVGADQKTAFQYLVKPDKSGVPPYKQFGFNSMHVISRQETNDPSKGEEGPRATPMRDVLKDPNVGDQEKFSTWRNAMNPEISDDEVRDLMQKAKTRMSDPAWGKKAPSIKKTNQQVRDMRAKEFTLEGKNQDPIDLSSKLASKDLTTTPRANLNGGDAYLNYRMNLALAGAPDYPTKAESEIGGDPLYSAYTDAEWEMIKMAAKVSGAGPLKKLSRSRSEEMPDVNAKSVVAKPKKNQYGI